MPLAPSMCSFMWINRIISKLARAISKIIFILELYKLLAYMECIRSYAWSFGHSDPYLSSVNMESSKEQFRISIMKSGNQILVVGGCYISRYFWSSFVDILLVGVFVHLLREVFWGDDSMLIWILGGSFLRTLVLTCLEIHL